MSKMTDEFVEVFVESLMRRTQQVAKDVWPSPLADVKVAVEISGNYVLDLLEKVFDHTDDLEILSQAFIRPSRLAYFMYLFSSRPQNNDVANKRVLLAEKMLRTISYMRNGDLYLKGKSNIIWCEKKLNVSCDEISANQRNIINRILMLLSVINEFSYFSWLGLGREFCGPFIENNKAYLVYEFYDMKPDFWEFTSLLKWKSIKMICNIPKDCKIDFDFNGRLNKFDSSEITEVSLFLDGVRTSLNDELLNDIYINLLSVLKIAKKDSLELSSGGLLDKFVESQIYAIREAADSVGVNIPQFLPLDLKEKLSSPGDVLYRLRTFKLLKDANSVQERKEILKRFFSPDYMEK